jgi:hypothetical protein
VLDKLGVTNRTEAVARARELDLIAERRAVANPRGTFVPPACAEDSTWHVHYRVTPAASSPPTVLV